MVEPPLRPSDCCSRGGVGACSSHLYAPATAAHDEESARDRDHLYSTATAAHEEESARGRATSTPQRLLLTRRSRRVIEPPLRSSDCCSRGGVGACSSHLYPQRLLLTRRSRRVFEPPLRPSDCCSRGGVGA